MLGQRAKVAHREKTTTAFDGRDSQARINRQLLSIISHGTVCYIKATQ